MKKHTKLSPQETNLLKEACKALGPGADHTCNDYVQNLMNMALDFQMHTEVVTSSVDHFNNKHGFTTHAQLRKLIDAYPNTQQGNSDLAKNLWNNNHWTRAEFLRAIFEFLEGKGIRGQVTLNRWVLAAELEQDVRALFEKNVQGQIRTSHHSIGFTLFQWMRLRHGQNTVKPDLHVLNFVENAIGRRPSIYQAVDWLETVAKSLKRKAPRLDAAIWEFQRAI